MKTKILIAATAAFLMTLPVSSQINKYSSMKNETKTEFSGDTRIFAGMSVSYTSVDQQPAAYLGARAGLKLSNNFSIGIAGSALWYDYRLTGLVDEGTYHLESGYTGLFVEFTQHMGEHVSINLSLLTGQGIAIYRMDRAYTESLSWYNEKIDEDTFGVMEPGIELLFRTGDKFSIGLSASYCSTSPLQLAGSSHGMLDGFRTGISFRYSIF
ncbi:MAG: hypothetical protein K9J25_04185 [Bacteroidales bacterium]|nr:hypothetical protein [Bacteroidales bacterium]